MLFDKSFVSFLLYFPCIMLGVFFVYLMIIWMCRKAMANVSRGQLWERIGVFVLIALAFSAMLVSDLCILDTEFMLCLPYRFFYASVIIGIPTLVLTTFVILLRCIESWSDACSMRKKVGSVFLIFLIAWLFCFLVQIIIFVILIKQLILININ